MNKVLQASPVIPGVEREKPINGIKIFGITGFACDPGWGAFTEKALLTAFVSFFILHSRSHKWGSM